MNVAAHVKRTSMIKALKKFYREISAQMARPVPRRLGPVVIGALAFWWWRNYLLFAFAYALAWMLWENFINIRPLNIMVRYFAVLDILNGWKKHFNPHPSILEVGSGSQGLGHLIPYPFYGCDIRFDGSINPNMRPVLASGPKLPFKDNEFDIVLSLDMMEHISTEARRKETILDMWRVAKKALIVGFPAGEESFKVDEELKEYYLRHKLAVPVWLAEHSENKLPARDFMESFWGTRSPLAVIRHEPLAFHLWMMKKEAHWWGFYLLVFLVLLTRPFLHLLFRMIKPKGVAYRHIYVLTKDSELK